jgi:hypothetical protein
MISYMLMLLIFSIISFSCSNDKPQRAQEPPVFTPPNQDPPPLRPPIQGYIGQDEGEALMLLDAQTLNVTEAEETFYLVGCNYFNSDSGDLPKIVQGINKGLNSISTERALSTVTRVGDQNCIWRANQENFGISRGEWQRIERALPLQFVSDTVRNRSLQAITQKLKPWVFVSDFFNTIYQADAITEANGIFYDLTEQPSDLNSFFTFLGINLQTQYDRQEVVCAGGDNSQIALKKHRLMCITDIDNGRLMSTYDVDLGAPDTVTENFATLEMAQAGGILQTQRIFNHAAQEHFYQLPNGLWQGRLNNAAGNAETVAPASIVTDIKQADLDPQIRLGACLNCHHNEMGISFSDDVARFARGAVFNAREKILIETFFKSDSFQGELNSINREYSQNMAEIGVDTNDIDPLTNNVIRPLRGEQTIEIVASYMWMQVDEFETCLRGAAQSQLLYGNLLEGGTVSYADMSRGWSTLVDECGAYRDRGQL